MPKPANGCRTLGSADFIRVPLPAASTTAARGRARVICVSFWDVKAYPSLEVLGVPAFGQPTLVIGFSLGEIKICFAFLRGGARNTPASPHDSGGFYDPRLPANGDFRPRRDPGGHLAGSHCSS